MLLGQPKAGLAFFGQIPNGQPLIGLGLDGLGVTRNRQPSRAFASFFDFFATNLHAGDTQYVTGVLYTFFAAGALFGGWCDRSAVAPGNS
jgi:hypothetical protein